MLYDAIRWRDYRLHEWIKHAYLNCDYCRVCKLIYKRDREMDRCPGDA